MKITNNPEKCTDKSTTQTPAPGASANNININLGGATIFVVILLTVVIGASGVIMGLNLAKQDQMDRDFRADQRQAQLTERRLIDMETYAEMNGWKVPGDTGHGPTGNLQRMKPRENVDGRK